MSGDLIIGVDAGTSVIKAVAFDRHSLGYGAGGRRSVGGMPVGVQIVGLPQEDAKVTALARWVDESVAPVVR